ncbi:MAG: iron-containing alcohol dehydrogenase [Syntrophothermus sp.]
MLPEYFAFFSPTRIVVGPGVAGSLGQEMEKLGVKRAFVVTDKVLVQMGLVEQVLGGLTGSAIELAGIFDEVKPNSEVGLVEKGAELAKAAGADVLVAIGGGSNIDTAKGMNLILSEGGRLLDYEGFGVISRPLKPLVAIPTTAGTGSEVTQFAVIKNEAIHAKLSFSSPFLAPNLAILDPELTVNLPPKLTASTGMDALTHAVEAYVSTCWNPVADGLALEAIRMIGANLVEATTNGANLEARYQMLVASTMAGLAFSSGMVGCVHAMAHAAGGLYDVPHGIANSILLPYGMEYNLEARPEKFREIARALGKDVQRKDTVEGGRAAIQAVFELAERCGLPRTLREMGVPAEGLPQVAETAMVDGAIFTNPRPAEYDEILAVLKKAY